MTILESRLVAAAGLGGQVRFVNLSSGACVSVLDEVEGASLHHINKLHAHEHCLFVCGNPWIRLYSMDCLEVPPTVYSGHKSNVTTIDVQRDARWFISADESGKVCLWDLRASGHQLSISHASGIYSGRLHRNQQAFTFGDAEGFVNHFDLAANRIVKRRFSESVRSGAGIAALVSDEGDRILCAHENQLISVLDDLDLNSLETSELAEDMTSRHDDSSPRHGITPPPPPMLMPLISRSVSSIPPVRPTAVTQDEPQTFTLKRDPIQSFGQQVHKQGSYITSLSVNSVGNTLSSTCSDGAVALWRLNQDEGLWGLESVMEHSTQNGSDRWCWDSEFVDDRFVIAAYADGLCKLWDSARPSSPPVASYDCGGGKGVRTIVVINSWALCNQSDRRTF